MSRTSRVRSRCGDGNGFGVSNRRQGSEVSSNVLSGALRLPLAFATITVFLALSLLALSGSQASAHGKFSAYAIDITSGRVLYARNGDARRYPASLTKMMTLYLLFEQFEQGRAVHPSQPISSTTTIGPIEARPSSPNPSSVSARRASTELTPRASASRTGVDSTPVVTLPAS